MASLAEPAATDATHRLGMPAAAHNAHHGMLLPSNVVEVVLHDTQTISTISLAGTRLKSTQGLVCMFH